ncbi:MAG TPA: GNAT family N-acetyltransferase [Anaerolineales bacterium]|nr:GNAT family N-acetyltransferase [Anaerolineales bacterium]
MAHRRFEYVFELKNFKPVAAPDALMGTLWRNPSTADKQILAELMLDSYRGTIDYDDETLEDAVNEVGSYYARLSDPMWLESSWLGLIDDALACACLVDFWKERRVPLIAYMMTASRWKGKQLATTAVLRTLQSLANKNLAEVRAVITEGNFPSEKVFTRLGFQLPIST